MKKLILTVGLLATLFTGCEKREKNEVIIEEVKIQNGCFYYLEKSNTTVYDIYCTNYDKNSNGFIVVSYEMDGFTANILKIEDDKK